MPGNKVIDNVSKVLEKKGLPKLDSFEIPSAHAFNKISETFAKMKATEKLQGIISTEVQAFKNQICIYMQQALIYENFLKR